MNKLPVGTSTPSDAFFLRLLRGCVSAGVRVRIRLDSRIRRSSLRDGGGVLCPKFAGKTRAANVVQAMRRQAPRTSPQFPLF